MSLKSTQIWGEHANYTESPGNLSVQLGKHLNFANIPKKYESTKLLTGSWLNACGRMDESVSHALVCKVGCCSFCKAPMSGPVNISDQNCTTYPKPKKNLAIK